MLLFIEILKLLAEIALMALAGQWVLGLLAGRRRRPEPVLPAAPGAHPSADCRRADLAPRGAGPAPAAGGLPAHGVRLDRGHHDQDRHLRADRGAPVQVMQACATAASSGGPWRRWCWAAAKRRWRCSSRCCGSSPDDAYALASKAHLQAQVGDRAPRWSPWSSCWSSIGRGRHLLVQLRLPARGTGRLGARRGRVPPRHRTVSRAGPGLVRPGPGADPHAAPRRSGRRAQAQHPIAAHEPVRLVPAGAGPCGPARARGGAEDHPPPPEVRAQGRRAAGARDGPSSRPPAERVLRRGPRCRPRRGPGRPRGNGREQDLASPTKETTACR